LVLNRFIENETSIEVLQLQQQNQFLKKDRNRDKKIIRKQNKNIIHLEKKIDKMIQINQQESLINFTATNLNSSNSDKSIVLSANQKNGAQIGIDITSQINAHEIELEGMLLARFEKLKEKISDFASANSGKIYLNGKRLNKWRLERCLQVQILAEGQWVSVSQITKITGLVKNNTTLYEVIDDLYKEGYLERRHPGKQASGQRYRMIRKFVTDFDN